MTNASGMLNPMKSGTNGTFLRDGLSSSVTTATDRAPCVTIGQQTQFIAAANRFQEVGQKVAAANRALVRRIEQNGTRRVEKDHLRPLNTSIESLSNFILPTELSPESVRSVDRHIREIDQAIEAHHAAALNIR